MFGRSGRLFPTPYRFGHRWMQRSVSNLFYTFMSRTQISSTSLRSVGYDQATSTLEVEFCRGNVYRYSDVPASRYEGLLSAYSHGSYFDRFIKNGGYAYQQIR